MKQLGEVKLQKGQSKKKKGLFIGLGILLLLIIIGVVLYVVLVVMKKDDSNDDGPVKPPFPTGYNPYHVDESTVTETRDQVTGILRFTHQVRKLMEVPDVDSIDIPVGENNPVITELKFEIGHIH